MKKLSVALSALLVGCTPYHQPAAIPLVSESQWQASFQAASECGHSYAEQNAGSQGTATEIADAAVSACAGPMHKAVNEFIEYRQQTSPIKITPYNLAQMKGDAENTVAQTVHRAALDYMVEERISPH